MFMVIFPGSRVNESRVHVIFLLIIYFMLLGDSSPSIDISPICYSPLCEWRLG